MTRKEVDEFLKKNTHITAGEDGDAAYFRNEHLPWYRDNEGRATRITWDGLSAIGDGEELLNEINRGLEVEQITRITGYFTKLSSWNKGKLAELRDRERVGNYFEPEV